MDLGTLVAWSAIIACIISAMLGYLNRRDAGRERARQHAAEVQMAYDRGRQSTLDELGQVRADRDYWRDIVVRRNERGD